MQRLTSKRKGAGAGARQHGPSTLGDTEIVYLKLRAYTGQNTQVL